MRQDVRAPGVPRTFAVRGHVGPPQGRTIIDWLVAKKSWKDPFAPLPRRPNGPRNNSRDFPEEPSRRLR